MEVGKRSVWPRVSSGFLGVQAEGSLRAAETDRLRSFVARSAPQDDNRLGWLRVAARWTNSRLNPHLCKAKGAAPDVQAEAWLRAVETHRLRSFVARSAPQDDNRLGWLRVAARWAGSKVNPHACNAKGAAPDEQAEASLRAAETDRLRSFVAKGAPQDGIGWVGCVSRRVGRVRV